MISALVVGAQFLLAPISFAHPASSIAVDEQGNVYFVHTGRGCAKIDPQGKLTAHTVDARAPFGR